MTPPRRRGDSRNSFDASESQGPRDDPGTRSAGGMPRQRLDRLVARRTPAVQERHGGERRSCRQRLASRHRRWRPRSGARSRPTQALPVESAVPDDDEREGARLSTPPPRHAAARRRRSEHQRSPIDTADIGRPPNRDSEDTDHQNHQPQDSDSHRGSSRTDIAPASTGSPARLVSAIEHRDDLQRRVHGVRLLDWCTTQNAALSGTTDDSAEDAVVLTGTSSTRLATGTARLPPPAPLPHQRRDWLCAMRSTTLPATTAPALSRRAT